MNWFRFKACVKCGGDLVLDQSDWLCLQCGTYYYTGLYQGPSSPDDRPMERKLPPLHKTVAGMTALVPMAIRTPRKHITASLLQGSAVAAMLSRI